MDLATGLVEKVERALISIPFIGVEVAPAKSAEAPTDLSEDQIGDIQNRLQAMSVSEAGEARPLVALASTSDTLGIFLRAHVLLENYLDRCINAYLVEPLNLYKNLEIFFSQKIRLATSLGLISTAGQRLLKKLNRIRNDLAHLPENKNQPPYRLTVGEQKSIWNDFTELPAFKAKSWPQFDAVNGLSIKTMLIAFIMEMQRRESIIESRRLGAIADEILA